MTLILTNDDVEKLLPMHECIEVLEDVYVKLSAGRAVNRIRSDSLVPTTGKDAIYSLKSMDAVIPKLGVGAVRIDSDIVMIDNLPAHKAAGVRDAFQPDEGLSAQGG